MTSSVSVQTRSFTLTLSCPNRTGIVQAVSSYLVEHECDIVEYRQFDDAVRGRLFLRVQVAAADDVDLDAMSQDFVPVATDFEMDFALHPDRDARVVVMVSKLGHCLNDLIYRWRAGALSAEIVAVVSNHEDLRPMAEAAGLPFHHVPVTPESKPEAEAQLLRLVDDYEADLVVLARYMQVLSDQTCKALHGRAINIHHSFLPGFKGAKPYHQAYDRGVKLVGATAHFVTPDLDEGPIIEQEVIRIDHTYDPRALQTVGRDAEALALSRAVRWYCENRVLLNGTSTVVFR
ncbi:formyltetrahydrofolate deformylase [Prauserella rugosa]|uniref:Formyltetrahydrofolate deformylase n=1 Tax=Prauserella rugosa TaxID=43354 RepID=A0A660C5J9_9PSEU|nr:formyltetrahydrofolate deformylase [Prauserella rugosa]KID29990.1 formyltetrahydrofolate deformylase [Prauserella sp. Am3]TWH18742.1 formyltetrahydrofolate deformylase [Prauserella rugosa]